jgi:serpin B
MCARGAIISEVFTQAFIAVDEAGTVAAAATGSGVSAASAPPAPPREIRVDHPFLFLIRDVVTGAILFIGRVADPR